MSLLLPESAKPQVDSPFGRILVGSIYSGICVLGIMAVFYPKKCQNNFMLSAYGEPPRHSDDQEFPGKKHFKGHHPDCEKFSANRIQIRQATLCASCAGLAVGAVIAFAGTLLYFFLNNISIPADPRNLWISNFGMLFGLVQFKLKGYAKLAMNTIFVLCSFMILATVDLLTKNLLMDLYALAIIISFLLTRITISQWNNRRICAKCGSCISHL